MWREEWTTQSYGNINCVLVCMVEWIKHILFVMKALLDLLIHHLLLLVVEWENWNGFRKKCKDRSIKLKNIELNSSNKNMSKNINITKYRFAKNTGLQKKRTISNYAVRKLLRWIYRKHYVEAKYCTEALQRKMGNWEVHHQMPIKEIHFTHSCIFIS